MGHVGSYLSKGQRLRRSLAGAAYRLFDQHHGELSVGYAVRSPAGVVISAVAGAGGHVRVHSQEQVLEALAGVGHAAQLEASAAAA